MSDAILDKVRKLLAKAEDPACTPAEAEAFTEKAAQLIAKYGVDAALLAEADPARDPVGDRVVDIPAPYATEKCALLSEVATELRCRAVRRMRQGQGRQGKEFSMHLFGHATDLERVDVLFTSLLVQATFALAAQHIPGHEHVAAYRRSWLIGFARAIGQRLRAAEERATREATPVTERSVALVLADRTAEVEQRVSQAYPKLTFAPPRRLAGGGMHAGYAAGQRADLGGVRLRQRSAASLRKAPSA